MKIRILLIIFFLSTLIFITAVYILLNNKNNNPVMSVSYLYVGQGDSTLIQTTGGNKILIDVGPDGRVLDSLSKELSFFEKDINSIFITHSDADHIGGIIDIIKNFNISNIYVTSIAEETDIYDSLYKELEKEDDIIITKLNGSNEVLIDKKFGITLDILFPIDNYNFKNRNDKSFVMRLIYGDTSFMFSGDTGVDIEKYIVNNSYESLKGDVLKVGHHGSNTSTGIEFLKAVSPQYGVISSGIDNDFGHPHLEVLKSLENENIEVMRTDELGNITIISDGKSVLSK